MTTTERRNTAGAPRRPLAPAARRAAARMVIAADKASGKTSDPRVVAIAEGHDTGPAETR